MFLHEVTCNLTIISENKNPTNNEIMKKLQTIVDVGEEMDLKIFDITNSLDFEEYTINENHQIVKN